MKTILLLFAFLPTLTFAEPKPLLIRYDHTPIEFGAPKLTVTIYGTHGEVAHRWAHCESAMMSGSTLIVTQNGKKIYVGNGLFSIETEP